MRTYRKVGSESRIDADWGLRGCRSVVSILKASPMTNPPVFRGVFVEYSIGWHPDTNTRAMAELSTTNESHGTGGKVRAKKLATKIGMTPMLDLAFLLLTFFLLTTTFMKPSVMSLTMPEPEDLWRIPGAQVGS